MVSLPSAHEQKSASLILRLIVVAPRRTSTRAQPTRSTRAQVSNASPVMVKRTGRKSQPILISDAQDSKMNKTSNTKAGTARNRVRQDIADHTKPRRDAFLLAHSKYFLPLLPETNYIDKLQRIQAVTDEDAPQPLPHTRLTEQPTTVKAVMKPYQLEGLSFLVHMYRNGVSSILGDEMGLGKTLQTLSLFAYLSEHEPKSGENRPHLVICPLSVLSSWMSEARKWTPSLKVMRFHGSKAERDRLKLEAQGKIDKYGNDTLRVRNKKRETRNAKGRQVIDLEEPEYEDAKPVDVVVTTYETFVSEQSWFKTAFVWRFCVLDEGHKVKNEKSDVSRAVQTLKAEFRLLLTGTPLQNNLKEMWALLHWLVVLSPRLVRSC